MIEGHYSRIIAPKMKLWYPNKKLPASYPTVSDRCARARWLAIQVRHASDTSSTHIVGLTTVFKPLSNLL